MRFGRPSGADYTAGCKRNGRRGGDGGVVAAGQLTIVFPVADFAAPNVFAVFALNFEA
jgi:hypothetical protein